MEKLNFGEDIEAIKKMNILTHRGLDPEQKNYFAESSREAFADQLARGFGLELDLQFAHDGALVVSHDADLKRLTGGRDERKINEVDSEELMKMDFAGCHLVSFNDLLRMIAENPNNRSMNAVHIKSGLQKQEHLDTILEQMRGAELERFMLFDVKIGAARYLKEKNPGLHLAASVSHPYDIKRYNEAVGGTLLPIEEVIQNRDMYDWVWLDEWDRKDKNGGRKALYTKEVFVTLRAAGFKIALVTPELHGSSPGLLGEEVHEDAADPAKLFARCRDIIKLQPDALCTDYPDAVRELTES